MTPEIFTLEIERAGDRHERSVWTLYAKDPETGKRVEIGEPHKNFCMVEPSGAAMAFESIVADIANESLGERLSS